MAVDVGQQAPNFTLADTERKPRSLSDYRGKNVVLAFMPGAFTGVCTKEVCAFRDSSARLNGLDAQVIGITVDSPFALKAWAEQNKLDFLLLSDYERKAVNQYGATLPNLAGLQGYVAASRSVFVVDKHGVVRYKWAGEPAKEPPYDEITQALSKLKG